jgi:hypothetical protein
MVYGRTIAGHFTPAVRVSSALSSLSSSGTPFSASVIDARPEAELALPAAAFTCIIKAVQYPFGSAHAGIGLRAALATAGPAFFSAAVRAVMSWPVLAEPTAFSAATSFLAEPRIQASYFWGQLTGAVDLVAECVTAECVTAECVTAAPLAGAADVAALWLHAVSVTRAPAAAAASVVGFMLCSVSFAG